MLIEGTVSVLEAIAPAAIHTTTPTPTACDVSNCGKVLIVINVGAITDGVHTVSITECDTVAGSYTAVAAAQVVGTPGALVTLTPVAFWYLGVKQFIKVNVTVSGGPGTGGYYDAQVILLDLRSQT